MARPTKTIIATGVLGVLLLATPAQARILGHTAGSENGAPRLDPAEICTFDRCGPRRGDSAWSLAGFGLAVLAAAGLGRRRRDR